MSIIRLSKVAKDFNVGVQTLVETLQKSGAGDDLNPNSKISDEQYSLLRKEFSRDKDLKDESDRISQERHSAKDKKKESVAISEPVQAVTSSAEEMRPKIKEVGRIDLDAINKPKKPVQEVKIVEKPAIETVTKTVSDVNVTEKMQENKDDVNKGDEVFRLNKPATTPSITVLGTIDLAALNQQTRPKKKSKEEKKKERESKDFRNPANKKPGEQSAAGAANDAERRKRNRINKQKVDINTPGAQNAQGGNNNQGGQNHGNNNNNNQGGQNRQGGYNNQNRQGGYNNQNRQGGQGNQGGQGGYNNQNRQGGQGGQGGYNNQNRQGGQGNQGGQNGPNRGNNQGGQNRHGNNNRPNNRPVVKQEVSDEDVQKQIKETLARLTSKGAGNKKGAKYRKDKRDMAAGRAQAELDAVAAESKLLKLTEFVTANDLANMMGLNVNQVIGTCMSIGMMVSINQRLDAETINIVAEEFGFKTEYVSAEVVEAIQEVEDAEEDLISRPPIVTVMGHVDHGKTSLLDYIRKANVIAGEAGGITQHIGAYNVKLSDGRHVTFLDTPGHEAFTAMRARGAKITDIAIIIVAADDAVMPQTVEAINHASAAGVPIVFAINKIDKVGANPEKIRETLATMNYLVEDWGGKYQCQEISAKQGLNVEELLEKVLLEAELLELKANPNRRATGSVIESTLDKGRGYVATVMVQNGTLKIGDVVLAGTHFGRVKAMFNERNQKVTEAGPAVPVQILGFNGAPQAGDIFHVMETEQEAREVANKREQLAREQGLRTQKILTLDDIGRRIAIGNFQELNVIVKGDVDGSVEALSDSLIKLSTPEIQVNVIHKAVGQISESDVTLAAASNAIIIGFQVRPSLAARRLAEKDGVEVRLYSIIYDAIEEVKDAMEGMLQPDIKEEIVGYLEVRETFKITKVGTVAGCIVKEGKIKRNNKIRIIRDGIVVYQGALGSLKRFKEDVKEVSTNFECGLNIDKFNDLKVGDLIESYEETEVKKQL